MRSRWSVRGLVGGTVARGCAAALGFAPAAEAGTLTPPAGAFLTRREGDGAMRAKRLMLPAFALAILGALILAAPAGAVTFNVPGSGYTAVTVGDTFVCALKTDKTIVCMGAANSFGELNAPAGTFTQLDTGEEHTCALSTGGTLACWGFNGTGAASPPRGAFTQVSAGFLHSCAVASNQTIACWGDITGTPPAGAFLQVATANGTQCGLHTDHTIACTDPGGVATGVFTAPTGTFTSLSASESFFSCALTTAQTILCWGINTRSTMQSGAPGATFTAISAGGAYGCALSTTTAIACWGDPTTGAINPPPGGGFVQIDSGVFTACAVRADTTITCWGRQLALGAGAPAPIGAGAPAPVAPAPVAPAPGATRPAGARAPSRALPAAFGANGVFSLPSNRSCVSRRHFRIRTSCQRAGVTLISAAVAVNGHRVAVRKGRRLTAPVDLRGLPRGRFTVRISALTTDGRAITEARRYRTCAPRRAAGGHGPLVLAAALPGEGS